MENNKNYNDGFYYILSNYNGKWIYNNLIQITSNENNKKIITHSIGDLKVHKIKYYFLRTVIPDQERPFTKDIFQSPSINSDNKKITSAKLNAGESYKDIYRPVLSQEKIDLCRNPYLLEHMDLDYFDSPIFNTNKFISDFNQLQILIELIEKVFKYISPVQKNMETFGNELRNIIILACTEVESLWKDTLLSNNYANKKLTTKDYVELLSILKLNEYKIKFNFYPDIEEVSPFSNWNTKSTTQSLSWYSDYNAIKHDRLNEFSKATLKNAIESVSAVVIMLIAKYGYTNIYWKTKIENLISITEIPDWEFEDYYIPPIWSKDGLKWKEINFFK